MKKKIIDRVFIALFVLLCLIPSVGMLVFGESQAAANEILASRPKAVERDGRFNLEVLSDTTDYIADRFAFRQEMVTAWSWLNAKLLSSSVEDQVILGRDGWLFYGETLDDYIGKGLKDYEIVYAAKNLSLMQEYVEKQGGSMVFTIAPNKNSLYGEYMPRNIDCAGGGRNAERLIAQLEACNVNYADLFTAFRENKTLYFKTDSHWNSEGAALAADAILGRLGRNSAFFSAPFSAYAPHKGDLYEMLYPAGKETESDPQYSPGFSFECLNDPNGGNAIKIETRCAASEGRLMCWRDSFGISLYPYLAESFAAANFSRSSQYDMSSLDREAPAAIIIELVERNIKNLVASAPVFEAPVRELEKPEAEGEGVPVSMKPGTTESTAALVHITGELPISSFDAGSQVYVCAADTVYEACVIKGSDDGHLAFSVWVSAEKAAPQYIISTYNGEPICFPAEI